MPLFPLPALCYPFSLPPRLWSHILTTLDLLPSLLAQTLPSCSAPVDAGGQLFFINRFSTLMAFHPGLIGEYLLLSAAVRTFIELHLQPSEVLTGTSDRHLTPPRLANPTFTVSCT